MRFASLEEARNARGVRLVVVAGVPSPWSEAAKGTFKIKGIDGLLVRFIAKDEAVQAWTHWHNAPALFVDDDPPRTHWTEILEAAERLGGPSLLPRDLELRARMFGLSHALLGENGLVWNGRILVIHRGLETEGKEGFPVPLAKRLATKYGYAPERVEAARARAIELLERFAKLARPEPILGELSALDIHLATAMAPFAPMSTEQCPGMHPALRHAFATADAEMTKHVAPSLVRHRDWMYEKYLGLPVEI